MRNLNAAGASCRGRRAVAGLVPPPNFRLEFKLDKKGEHAAGILQSDAYYLFLTVPMD
jgi:hypothetical protein